MIVFSLFDRSRSMLRVALVSLAVCVGWLASVAFAQEATEGYVTTTDARLVGLNDSEFVAVLAAACAEAGDFDSAVKWQETAIDLAPKTSQADLRARLELYQAHKPYRDGAAR
jgi:hypothetical protein